MDENAIELKLDLLIGDMKIVKEVVTGNGDPQKGLVVRVDRLEQDAKTRKGLWNVVTAAIISALVALGFRQVAP